MAISVAQRITATDNGGVAGFASLVFGSNNTAGNTIVVAVNMGDSSQAIFQQEQRPPTDTRGNAYYLINSPGYNSFGSTGMRWYAAYNIPAGANTITVNDSNNDCEVVAYEVAGLASYAAFDKAAAQTQNSQTSFDSTLTATTSFANELLLGGFGGQNNSVFTVGAGYSNIQNIAGGGSLAVEERIVSATSTYNATVTVGAGSDSTVSSIITLADTALTTKTATVSNLGTTFNTNSGTHTVTATPAINDLIVIIRASTGNITTTAPTDNNPDALGTYTRIASALNNTSVNLMEVWIRNSLIGASTSTVFTEAPGVTTGGGLTVYKVTGMSKAGATAALQSATQANHAAAAAPAPAFTNNITSPNPVIGAVFNGTSATTTANVVQPVGFVQGNINGYATPTAGLQTVFNSGGSSGKTITWDAQSPTAFCSIIIELDASGSSVISPSQYLRGGGFYQAQNVKPKIVMV